MISFWTSKCRLGKDKNLFSNRSLGKIHWSCYILKHLQILHASVIYPQSHFITQMTKSHLRKVHTSAVVTGHASSYYPKNISPWHILSPYWNIHWFLLEIKVIKESVIKDRKSWKVKKTFWWWKLGYLRVKLRI